MRILEHVDKVLVLEDDYLIALDLGDLLARLGCAVTHLACSPEQALPHLDEVGFATIDVKLGADRCLPIVKKLEERGVPFIYVTGYSEPDRPDLPRAPWVTKPATSEDLIAAILDAMMSDPIDPRETFASPSQGSEQRTPSLVALRNE